MMRNVMRQKRKVLPLLLVIVVMAIWSLAAHAQEATYVGSDQCAHCHAAKHALYAETWHARILRHADHSSPAGDFSSDDPDLTFSQEDIVYIVGGQFKERYLTEIEGQLYVFPAEWNLTTQEWEPYYPDQWQERPYDRLCAGCHTTGFNPETGQWKETGVGCEACHGPGSKHVELTGNRTMIVNPALLEFEDQLEVCAQCHSRGQDPSGTYAFPIGFLPGGPIKLSEALVFTTDESYFWPDGSAKMHHMQYHDLEKGEHAGTINCVFCHTSHSRGETDHQTRMVGNHRCVMCHENQKDLGAHIPYMKDVNVFCTDCHMPPISKLVPTDFQVQSHTFWRPDPAKTIRYGGQEFMPNACNICHSDQTPEWAASILGQEAP